MNLFVYDFIGTAIEAALPRDVDYRCTDLTDTKPSIDDLEAVESPCEIDSDWGEEELEAIDQLMTGMLTGSHDPVCCIVVIQM
jgi:hypothetical protein